MKRHFFLSAAALLLAASSAFAASGTWLANPVDGDWSNPANWSSGTVPSGFDDATFSASSLTQIVIPDGASVTEFFFDGDAGAYTITASSGVGFGVNGGVINSTGIEQDFVATASSGVAGSFSFPDAVVEGPCSFTQEARNAPTGDVAGVTFDAGSLKNASAGSALFHNLGATVSGGLGGRTDFHYTGATADQCTIINEGGTAAGASGGVTSFSQSKPSAGNATLIANGGVNGGAGGSFSFLDASLGGTARAELFGNGYLDLSAHSGSTFTIGSIEGDGAIYLGKTPLMVGSNGLSTTFSGVLYPGSPTGGAGTGAVIKIGSGTLTLAGANSYSGGTTVKAGTLAVSNKSGSATGTGAVTVTGGTLGGSGIISGAVSVNSGAFLAPATGGRKQAVLTILSSLTLQADATYTYTYKARSNQARTDEVVANGVTINSGASIALSGKVQGNLHRGLVLTVLSNTSASPIAGTFSNLPDGALLSVGSNTLQASYEGGDGNDLTLTAQ